MTQALILAAGRGTRLGEMSSMRPKCLTHVGDRTILEHQLAALAEANIASVVIVSGFRADLLETAVSSRRFGREIAITFVRNHAYASTNVLASWFAAADSIHDDYVYLHGDTVFEPSLLHRLLARQSPAGPTLSYDPHSCSDEEMKVILREGAVERISKALDPAIVDGEFTGVLHCPVSAHEHIRIVAGQLLSEPEGHGQFFEAALQRGIDSRLFDVAAVDIGGCRWREIDFPEDLDAARAMFQRTGSLQSND